MVWIPIVVSRDIKLMLSLAFLSTVRWTDSQMNGHDYSSCEGYVDLYIQYCWVCKQFPVALVMVLMGTRVPQLNIKQLRESGIREEGSLLGVLVFYISYVIIKSFIFHQTFINNSKLSFILSDFLTLWHTPFPPAVIIF